MKKNDCHFYEEYHDMGACIELCNYLNDRQMRGCDGCSDHYISSSEASDLIREYLKRGKI